MLEEMAMNSLSTRGDCFVFPLSNDKFHRRRVHAIAQRGDYTKVSGRKQGIELVLLDGLVAKSGI